MTEGTSQPAADRGWYEQRPWKRRLDRVGLAGVVVCALGMLVASWTHQRILSERWLDLDRAPVATVSFQLDMNSADWPEWSLLPGVGEGLARRIVESRDRDGPFHSPDALTRVHGMGPKTLARIRPFLR